MTSDLDLDPEHNMG